jgi:4-alpha-glucanotransferase
MEMPRRSGLLLHITSLPGGPYNGDLGRSAYAFADFLENAGQAWWQTLPLNPIGEGHSPYSSIASFATEPLMVSPELLVEDGLLEPDALEGLPSRSTDWKADFERSHPLRAKLLRDAYRVFLENRCRWSEPFSEFEAREKAWLENYGLFSAFSERYGTADWTRWPADIVKHDPDAMRAARNELREGIEYLAFAQFLFDRQWQALKRYCNEKGIGIVGDIPMFVAHQSADVWANQDSFLLDDAGRPTFVAGAPPDAFAEQGQRWGNALYDWDEHERTGFEWWTQRIRRQLELFDILRLDHFIGFARYWRIPAESETAMDGSWVPAPGNKFFDALRETEGRLPFIAEDLGSVSKDVWDLRDRYELPGMKVLQFAFDGTEENVHHPQDYPTASVAYTGTHDSDTTRGWYQTLKHRAESGDQAAGFQLGEVQRYLGTAEDAAVVPALVRALSESRASTVILPLQDVLDLDGQHRMNTPGTNSHNWTWRLQSDALPPELADRLRDLANTSGRLPDGWS